MKHIDTWIAMKHITSSLIHNILTHSYETYNFFINTCNILTGIAMKHITSSLIHVTY